MPSKIRGGTADKHLADMHIPRVSALGAGGGAAAEAYLAYDTFTRANGALGQTEAAGPLGEVLTPKTWLFTSGVWAVSGNAAVGTPNVGADVIVNGGFAADTDWSKDAGWTIAGGKGVATAAANNTVISEAVATVGTWYRATMTVSNRTAGSASLLFGSAANGGTPTTNGTITDTRRQITGTSVGVKANGSTSLEIDDVSFLPLVLKDLFSSVSTSTPNVTADVKLTLVAGMRTQSGLVVNLDSDTAPANFVIAYVDRGEGVAILTKCVAGTYTQVIGAAVAYSAGAVLRVIKSGTSYSLWYNGAQVGTTQTISDAGVINNTLHGLFSTSASNSLDDYTLDS